MQRIHAEVRELARNYGLDTYEVIFELIDADELNMVAAYGGFPTRYPHWRFGMEYEQLQTSYTWGLSKIYELVINNDPCYAYLMRSNSLTDQKLVMAHVYGHCDFFKNNAWFSQTPRKMMDIMANHGARIRRYMDRHGQSRVEDFIDRVQALDNLIDPHAPFIQREDGRRAPEPSAGPTTTDDFKLTVRAEPYMDRYINPPEYLERKRQEAVEGQHNRSTRIPAQPQRDVLKFMLEHAPLELWEQDVLSMLRDEAYYFAPQGMTKIMNEGWAVYWHSKLMTRHLVEAAEVINYADAHSGTLYTQPGQINPYKLGVELFHDIETRWDCGKFGLSWERCDDWETKRDWNTGAGLGREKIFEVRRIYNDISFVDEFVHQEFAERQKMFVYGFNQVTNQYEIMDRDYTKVKSSLLNSLTNFGQPIVYVVESNYKNRGELYLYHEWAGSDLQFEQALQTLRYLQEMWKRPVHLETRENGEGRLLSFDGKEPVVKEITGSKRPEDVVGVIDGDEE